MMKHWQKKKKLDMKQLGSWENLGNSNAWRTFINLLGLKVFGL